MKSLRSIYALPPSLRQTVLTTRPSDASPICFALRQSPQQSRTLSRCTSVRHASSTTAPPKTTIQQQSSHPTAEEPLIPAPRPNSGPLLSRLPNRALPAYKPGLSSTARLWLTTLPIFILLVTLSSLSIFNYQKSSSSTVNAILYALRTSPAVRALLGDEIYFASRIPWISGELNQLHGHIDISFWVKGTKGVGQVRFVSVRKTRDGFFETLEWSLKTEDGTVVQLLEVEGGRDPLGGQQLIPDEGGLEL